ncbi:MAG: hypothetical protein IJL72_07525 [Lachnospiraceae bacterium]|nr:hypothetical protein [Lachnospiraceae bacterium]
MRNRRSWIAVFAAAVLLVTACLSLMVMADTADGSGATGSDSAPSSASESAPSSAPESAPSSAPESAPSSAPESAPSSASESAPSDDESEPPTDTPEVYDVIEGDGAVWTEGDGDLVFHIDAPFEDFLGVMIDGGEYLAGEDYSVAEGSTIVSLKSNYVATLSVSTHTVDFAFAGGNSSATFTVNQKSASPTEAPAPTKAPSKTSSDTAPKTADDTLIALGAALVAMLILAVISWKRSRATKE